MTMKNLIRTYWWLARLAVFALVWVWTFAFYCVLLAFVFTVAPKCNAIAPLVIGLIQHMRSVEDYNSRISAPKQAPKPKRQVDEPVPVPIVHHPRWN